MYTQCTVYSMYNIAHIYIYTHTVYTIHCLHHEIRSAFPMFELRPLFSAVLAMLYWPVWC